MTCPYCESPFTRIEPNTACYTCHSCHRTFGHIDGSSDSCPKCGSDHISVNEDHSQCNDENCGFTTCIGYETINPEVGDYESRPGCQIRFQYRNGEPVKCPSCHLIDPLPIVGCAFMSEVDTEVKFPQSVMYPTRNRDEFFRLRAFDQI